MKAIHQVVAGFSGGDAISQEAIAIRSALRARGYNSEIYACTEFIHPASRGVAHPLDALTATADDLVLYHHSIGSRAGVFVRGISSPLVMIYHNVTPARYISSHNPKVAHQLEWGREQLGEIRGHVQLALGVSPYNELELKQAGYERTGVLPILLDETAYTLRPDRRIWRQFRDGAFNILFVGRVAPNKCAHDLIKVFDIYRKFIHPRSRLLLVGSAGTFRGYQMALQNMVDRLSLDGVVFAGHVSQKELLAYYQAADVFLSMSEHEGFCLPIVESFRFGRPVVAYAGSAVPGTVGEAGILFDRKDPLLVAEILERIRTDPALQREMVASGRRRFERHFSAQAVCRQLFDLLDPLLTPTGKPASATA